MFKQNYYGNLILLSHLIRILDSKKQNVKFQLLALSSASHQVARLDLVPGIQTPCQI